MPSRGAGPAGECAEDCARHVLCRCVFGCVLGFVLEMLFDQSTRGQLFSATRAQSAIRHRPVVATPRRSIIGQVDHVGDFTRLGSRIHRPNALWKKADQGAPVRPGV